MNPLNEVSEKITGLELTGKTVVIRASALRPQFAETDRRFKCQGGFGCSPSAVGRAVFGTFLVDGEETRMDRGDIEGIAVHS
jgi:hypothetical protein